MRHLFILFFSSFFLLFFLLHLSSPFYIFFFRSSFFFFFFFSISYAYAWDHLTGHPIDNGESYSFSVAALNLVGEGASGTHDDGTDQSLVYPLFTKQKYATSMWKFPLSVSPGRRDPKRWPVIPIPGRTGSERTISTSPPELAYHDDVVYVCTNVQYDEFRSSSQANESFRGSDVTVGHVQGRNATTGVLLFDFENPQYEPFVLGRNERCPSIDERGTLYVVSQTMNPNNTHIFLLSDSTTSIFRTAVADSISSGDVGKVQRLSFAGVEDYQEGRPWWNKLSLTSGETDLLFNFQLGHSFQTHKPWVVHMSHIQSQKGRDIYYNYTEHKRLITYSPPIRHSIVLGTSNTTVARNKYSFPGQYPHLLVETDSSKRETVAFSTSSDGSLYAWIGSSLSDGYSQMNGSRVLNFKSDQCDLSKRIVNTSTLRAANILPSMWVRKCGCPGIQVRSPTTDVPYRYTQTPLLHEWPINHFHLYVVSSNDGDLSAEINNPSSDERRNDLRTVSSMLSAIDVTTWMTTKDLYEHIHSPEQCLSGGNDTLQYDDIDNNRTRVVWSTLADADTGGIIHATPVGARDLLYVSRQSQLEATNVTDGNVRWIHTFASRIVDVYVAPGEPRGEGGSDGRQVYVRTLDRNVTALRHIDGVVIWTYPAAPPSFTRPKRGVDRDDGLHSIEGGGGGGGGGGGTRHTANSYYVQSGDGTTHALSCPDNGHIVLDRLVYVCPELTLVRPTSQDVCEELESPCVKEDQTRSTIRPATYWPGSPKTDYQPQRWDQGVDGVGRYMYDHVENGGTGL